MRDSHPSISLVLAAALLLACGAACAQSNAAPEPAAGQAVVAAPAPAVAQRGHRLVYSCRDGNVPMYADRPCGEASLLRSLDVYTPAATGRSPSTQAPPAPAVTRPARREAPAKTLQEAAEKCERLQKSLDDVDDRMRAGYPARQAAALWQRWREARGAVREAGC